MFILKSGIGSQIKLDNKTYTYFGGNNYLGLANNVMLKKGVIASIKKRFKPSIEW